MLVQTFPACVVTRAAPRPAQVQVNSDPSNEPVVLGDTVPAVDSTQTECGERQTVKESQLLEKTSDFSISRGQLVREQESDEEVTKLAKYAINETKASQEGQCFYWKSGVLMRKWHPRDVPADEEWTVVHQIVMPRKYRREILSLAHESAMARHLGVNKTYLKILNHFYWPHLRRDVSEYPMKLSQWHLLNPFQLAGNHSVKSLLIVLVPCPRPNQGTNTNLLSCAELHVSQRLFLFAILRLPES